MFGYKWPSDGLVNYGGVQQELPISGAGTGAGP